MNGFDAHWEIDLLKLLFAVALGGMIGLEREARVKPAGFRTMILIAVGATLFTIFSVRIAGVGADGMRDPGRIAAQIVTGVGFLGAGAILRDARHITGLTTAASIWLVASVGIGIGLGEYRTSLIASILIVLVLQVFAKIEQLIDERRADHAYSIEVPQSRETLDRVKTLVASCDLRLGAFQIGKARETFRLSFHAMGSSRAHEILTERLISDPEVVNLTRS